MRMAELAEPSSATGGRHDIPETGPSIRIPLFSFRHLSQLPHRPAAPPPRARHPRDHRTSRINCANWSGITVCSPIRSAWPAGWCATRDRSRRALAANPPHGRHGDDLSRSPVPWERVRDDRQVDRLVAPSGMAVSSNTLSDASLSCRMSLWGGGADACARTDHVRVSLR